MNEQERKEKHKAYMRDYMRRRRAKAGHAPKVGHVAPQEESAAPVKRVHAAYTPMPERPSRASIDPAKGRRAIDLMLREAVMNTQRMTPPPED